MPTKKIADLPNRETCIHPDHNPPTDIVYSPGVYEHECPNCHYKQTFTIRYPRYTDTLEKSQNYDAGACCEAVDKGIYSDAIDAGACREDTEVIDAGPCVLL